MAGEHITLASVEYICLRSEATLGMSSIALAKERAKSLDFIGATPFAALARVHANASEAQKTGQGRDNASEPSEMLSERKSSSN